jgi:hypothetical protein
MEQPLLFLHIPNLCAAIKGGKNCKASCYRNQIILNQ